MGKNRADCPACGRPLKYDAEHDSMVCPMGHYSEPVKNDVNVDSHDSVVNNYYQGPAKHQVDNRGSYEQMVERAQAYVVDDDSEAFKNSLFDLRDSYPQTYFGKLANVWLNNNTVDSVFHGPSLRSFVSGLKGAVRSHVNEDLGDDGDSGVTNLNFEVTLCGVKKMNELGIANNDDKKNLQINSDIELYISVVQSVIDFIDTANKPELQRLVKYDFETEYVSVLKSCREVAFDALRAFCDLKDSIVNYVNGNIGHVQVVVDRLAEKKGGKVKKPSSGTSGFIFTILCIITEGLALLFTLLATIFKIAALDSSVAGTLAGLGMFALVPHLIFSIIRGKQARDFSIVFLIIGIATLIVSFVGTLVCLNGVNAIPAFVLVLGGILAFLIRNLVKLPRTIKADKELKAWKNNYAKNQAELKDFISKSEGDIRFESVAEMAMAYHYDFSKWGR